MGLSLCSGAFVFSLRLLEVDVVDFEILTDWEGPNLVTLGKNKRHNLFLLPANILKGWCERLKRGVDFGFSYHYSHLSEAADVDFSYPEQTKRVSPSPFEHGLSFHLLPFPTDISKGWYERLDGGLDHGLTTNSHYLAPGDRGGRKNRGPQRSDDIKTAASKNK